MRAAKRFATSRATCWADLDHVPDLIVRPQREQDVVDVLDWCGREGIPVIPYGGGSSVVGGVEPRFDEPAVTVDTGAMDAVLEIDRISRAARIQAGRAGPGARGPAPPTRSDPAPLPAVLRVLHPRRLAGHPRRRPLRHALHPHRRPDRVDAGRDPDRGERIAAAAGIRRRALAGPAVPGLRGHARHHHRGVDAVAGPSRTGRSTASVRVRRSGPPPSTRPGPSRRPGCIRPTADCWTRPRRS